MPQDVVRVGDEFAVEVFLDTEQESINAIEGEINVSKGLALKEVRYAGSIVSWWLTQPQERNPGKIDFAGVVPGGYQATPEHVGQGNLFTLVFQAKEKGRASLLLNTDSKAYLNDGEGSALVLVSKSAQFTIGDSEGVSKTVEFLEDAVPPESFTPFLVTGESYGIQGDVLVFEANDKDSGMAMYEIAKSYFRFAPESWLTWFPAQSPHSVKPEWITQYIYVRAVDVAGNARVARISPSNLSFLSVFIRFVFPISAAGILIYVLFRHIRRHTTRRR